MNWALIRLLGGKLLRTDGFDVSRGHLKVVMGNCHDLCENSVDCNQEKHGCWHVISIVVI